MTPFRHILFPVDFSERCQAAVPFVAAMAQRCDANLTVIHVVSVPAAWYGSIDVPYPVMFDLPGMVQAGQKKLDAFLHSGALSHAARVVEHGDAAGQITEFAEQKSVDLIMMPTHGYGTFRSLLLGSVTAKVLHDASCAVWTAAHTDDLTTAGSADFKNLLCAIDLDSDSIDLIRYAAAFADEHKVKLRLVHAVFAAEIRPDKYIDTEFRRVVLEWVREQILVLQERAGTNLEVCIEGGSVSSVVKAAALHHKADLVVIGRGRMQQALGRLRTNAYAIIRDSPCAVLSL